MRKNEWLEKYHYNYCYIQNCFGGISKQASKQNSKKQQKTAKNSKKREKKAAQE